MILLGLDVETTGLNPTTDRITELGAVLWDTDTNAPIDLVNQLVDAKDRPPITKEITALTGITEEMLKTRGLAEDETISLIIPWLVECDYIVAHNAQFDRGFLNNAMLRCEFEREAKEKWLCTSKDVPYPEHITSRNLRMLGAEHKYINYFPHRAVFDVLAMLFVLSNYEIGDVIKLAAQKEYKVQALVSYHEKDLAKDRGYRWDGENKAWVKILKEGNLQKELDAVPFQTRVAEVREEEI